jgi:hypothetical protein
MKELTPDKMKLISGGAVFPSSPLQQLLGVIQDLFRLLGGGENTSATFTAQPSHLGFVVGGGFKL